MKNADLRLFQVLGTLQFKIIAGVIAALGLGIGLITALLVVRAERDTLDMQLQWESNETVRTAAMLARQVVQLQRALLSSIPHLRGVSQDDRAAITRVLESQYVLRQLFTGVFVASVDGQVLVSAESSQVYLRPPVNIADREYFQRTLSEDRAIISEALPDRVSGAPAVLLTQPAFDSQGRRLVLGGYLRLSTRDLLDGLMNADNEDAAAMVVVTDRDGRILAHPNRQLLLMTLDAEPRLREAFIGWQAMGTPVEPAGIRLQQLGELVSAAGVPGADWMIWRARSETDVLAPLHAARHNAIVGSVALIAILSTVLLILLRRMLRPLTLLEQRARHLFDAEFMPEAGWPGGGGEIGRLGAVLRRVGIERFALEAQNAETMRRLSSIMRAAPVGIAFARNDRFELVNAEFCRLMAATPHDLLGQPVRMLFGTDEEHAAFMAKKRADFLAMRSYVGEWELRRSDKTRFWAGLRTNPIDPAHRAMGTIWIVSDIEEQRLARKQLEWSATHDPLTGLANRKAFDTRVQDLFERRPATLPSAMIFIDLDRFKPVNDTAGHMAGDLVLLAVARAVDSCVRAGDMVARIGGDEFAVLLEGCPFDTAMRIAESARLAVSGVAVRWEQRTLRVGASVGVATLPSVSTSVGDWVEAADAACYAAKRAGRNAVHAATADSELEV